MTLIGMSIICASYLAMAASLLLIARAALALRSAIGRDYRYAALLAIAARAVIPGQGWLSGLDYTHAKHLQRFGRRIRLALALLGIPILFIGVLGLISP